MKKSLTAVNPFPSSLPRRPVAPAAAKRAHYRHFKKSVKPEIKFFFNSITCDRSWFIAAHRKRRADSAHQKFIKHFSPISTLEFKSVDKLTVMTQIQHRRRQLLAATALSLGTALASPLVRAASLGRRVVIVGGGWGGISAARHLRIAAPELDVVLLEKSPFFQSLPLSNPWIAGLPNRKLLSKDYRAAASTFGYRFLQTNVTAIDREQRKVHSRAGTFLYDWLILACGIRHDYSAWFGDERAAAEYTRLNYSCAFQTGDELTAVRNRISNFTGGDFLMNLPPPPYRCPPAPYERALCIGEFLKSRKIKGRLIILDPGAGLLAFSRRFTEDYQDQIVYLPHTPVRSVDPFAKVVYSDVEDYRFDEAILMPPQQAGELAWQANLIAPDQADQLSGWADQHPLRLHARNDERVYLVGDLIGKASPLFGYYTKTGHMAARLGRIAAMEIAARSRGVEAPILLPDSMCLVDTSLNPPENIRIEASYRQRGDGLIMQTIRQQRDPQPRGEEQAWAQGLLAELFG